MFERIRFRMVFGFWPKSARLVVDPVDEKVVSQTLKEMDQKVVQLRAEAASVEREFLATIRGRNAIRRGRNVVRRARVRANGGEAERLYRACVLAVRFGFRPVPRHQVLWDRAQAREAKARQVRAHA